MWRVYTVCNRFLLPPLIIDLPGGSDGEASAYNAGDLHSIPGSGRSSGEGNGNPLQYSCLENPMDGGAWWATVYGVAKSRTRLSDFTFTFPIINSLRIVTMSSHIFYLCQHQPNTVPCKQ